MGRRGGLRGGRGDGERVGGVFGCLVRVGGGAAAAVPGAARDPGDCAGARTRALARARTRARALAIHRTTTSTFNIIYLANSLASFEIFSTT